jgi:F0F1-type ATP synthase membrane subunit b/b'
MIARARESAEKTAEKIMIESREESERVLNETRKKIVAERESMWTDMKQELAGLVLLATEKVLNEKLKSTDDAELIRKAVEKI